MAESPLSDDSLSSIGASTEPLPASDGPFISPPSGPAAQVRSPPPASRKQLAGGNESDSTLTEQSSSEGRRDVEEDDEDDRTGEPTPKARPPKTNEGQVRRPIEDVTSDLSSANDSDEEVDTKPKRNALKLSTNSPPRLPVVGELNARRATSRPGSYSELDRDEEDSRKAEIEDDGLSSADGGDEDEVKRAGAAAKRGGKAARGARGRAKPAPRGRGGKKAAPVPREESPLTSEEEIKKDVEDAPAVEAPVSPPKGKGRGGKAARGGARGGKAAARGGKSAAPAPPVAKSRSRSVEREGSARSDSSEGQTNSRKRPREEDVSTAAPLMLDLLPDISSLPPLPPAPADPALLSGLDERIAELVEEKEEKEEKEDAEMAAMEEPAPVAMDVDQDQAEVESEETSQVKKKVVKKGKKGGKGKEKAKDQDADADETGTPAASDHEDTADSDDAFLRKRAEAMEALTRIEIEFARLRDRLYVERMTEVEKERIGVATGTHPELLHLTQLIELRRTKKLELAKKWLDGLEGAYDLHQAEAEHAVWNLWANNRSDLQTGMLEEANSKRRKLEREKRKMDRPKDDGLTPLLAPRPLPPVPLQHQRRLGFDGEHLTEADITWSLRHPDVRADASVSALDDDSTLSDLERMGLREPDRHAGPYTFEQLYGPPYGQAPFSDPRGLPAPYGYPSYDSSTLGMSQHHFAGPFGSHAPSLPPAGSRPPSNPRSSAFPKEMGGTANRAYNPFPNTYAEADSGALHAPAWQKTVGGATTFDEARRPRTPSAPNGGLADSLDIVAGHKERTIDGDGVKSVNGHNTLKARPSLDDHMAHARSPKAPPKVNGTDRASFLSIPVIPPFKGHSTSTTPAVIPVSTPAPTAATTPHVNDPTAPTAPPKPQTTPLLGNVALKAAPTLFGSFGAGVETATTKAA